MPDIVQTLVQILDRYMAIFVGDSLLWRPPDEGNSRKKKDKDSN